ncbi:MAG: ABC transporter ATP-binding protein [Clostridiales bacterium]|nr:ABC transporter ATP-binding protein [Clostridiales bacterium]
MQKDTKYLLEIKDLYLHFTTQIGPVQAVDGVDFKMKKNEAVVILGESGCGKSSLTKAILRLLPRNVGKYEGKVLLNGEDTMLLDDEDYRQQIRWKKMSLVPQAAMTSLNPVLKVGDQVAEPLIIGEGMDKDLAMEKAAEYFQYVGVPVDFLSRYAFELSGGMRQRAALAMALITEPDLVILDEPTSALDVLTQCNIMNLLKRIKMENQASFILVTHDIATSSELANRVAVMYAGEIIEVSDSEIFFNKPLHPYAQKLMASVPRLRGNDELEFIVGKPPSLIGLPEGCRFAPRCPFKHERCDKNPPVVEIGTSLVKCWLHTDSK